MTSDKNDFRKNGILRVQYFNAEEREKLLDTVESIGIPAGDRKMENGTYSPTGTNTFEINIKEKSLHYIGQPFIGAAMCSSGVRFYSVAEFCRIAELNFRVMPRFLLWHIPHDGRKFPEELLSSVCVPRERLEAYHEKMRDTDVQKLIPGRYAYQSALERFEFSRLFCDVEPLAGPKEGTEPYGTGLCCGRTFDGAKIMDISEALKERTLRYCSEHHRRMDEKCQAHPGVLLFDMHSYSDEIVPHDFLLKGRPTPDVCIGADPRFTPLSLIQSVRRRFEESGFTAELNSPYAGCYVPGSAVSGKSDCISIMLAFNKRTYLDANGKPDEDRTAVIRNVMEKIIVDCVDLGDGQTAVKKSSGKRP